MRKYQHIVIGAGSAGCVVAGRLADAGRSVLLVEAGPDTPPGHVPAAIRDSYPSAHTEPGYLSLDLIAEVGPDRSNAPPLRAPHPQARVVGGGSSVNGMLAMRGAPGDYDRWAEMGATGWDWQGVLPAFRSIETDLDVDDALHGQSGPLPIRRTAPGGWGPLTRAVVAAWHAQGAGDIPDLNGEGGVGIGACPVQNRPGERVSSASAFLGEATRARPNFHLMSDTTVARLRWDGTRVIGVEVETPAGRQSIDADDVILSAGSLHTAAMLMRAGVGPAADLQAAGIPVIADRRGVGRNLQNHPSTYVPMHLPRRSRHPDPHNIWSEAMLRYSSGLPDCPEDDMGMFAVGRGAWHPLGERMGAVNVTIRKPFSTGEVRIAPDGRTDIRFRLLSDDRDLERQVHGVRRLFAVLGSAEVRAARNEVIWPDPMIAARLNRRTTGNWLRASAINIALSGPAALRRRLFAGIILDVDRLARDDDAARDFVLQRTALACHGVGTCRIGAAGDPAAVVDPRCRVIGVRGLRIADGSVMPAIVSAGTNLPITMIGEKVAGMILEDVRQAA